MRHIFCDTQKEGGRYTEARFVDVGVLRDLRETDMLRGAGALGKKVQAC